MKSAAQVRALVEAALGPSFPSPFVLRERRSPELVPTGLAAIDALTGGLPRSSLTEISGLPSSGRTTLELALLASLTTNGEACALVDAEDAFDPASAQAAGVVLDRLLWVRCHGLEQALRAADLLLGAGGFGAVVLDLADVPARRTRRVPLSYWFRFRRAVENTTTVLALIDEEPCAKSAASLVLSLEGESVEWSAAAADEEAESVEWSVMADKVESRKSKVEGFKFQISNSLAHARHFPAHACHSLAHARLLRGIRWRAEVVRNRNSKREIRDSKVEIRNPKLVAVHHGRAIHDTEVAAQIREPVMLNPLTIPLPFDEAQGSLSSSRRLQTFPSRCSGQALSEAKELRVNSAKHPGISAFPSETNAGILRVAHNDGASEFPVSSFGLRASDFEFRVSNLESKSQISNFDLQSAISNRQ